MQKSNWICTDIDCAQFRREAPEKGSNVFELAQVNAYGDTYCVAHGFVYLDMDDRGNGTLKRIKKDSFEWMKEVIATGGGNL